MKTIIATTALALTIACSSALAGAPGVTEHIARTTDGSVLELANVGCNTPMNSPAGQPLHNALFWTDGHIYLGCWYPAANGHAYQIKIPRLTNGWTSKLRSKFLDRTLTLGN